MKHSVSLSRITETTSCVLSANALEIPIDVYERARSIWRDDAQFCDGEIVSIASIDGNRIVARRADYRWLLAQSKDESLFKWSQVRPLSLTGILFCPEGVIIGYRRKSAYQFAGLGELAPSGYLDLSTLDAASHVNPQQQLMQELHKEIGIDADSIAEIEPLALMSDNNSQAFNIGFTVRTPLSWAKIQLIFSHTSSTKYDRLELLPVADIPRFLQTNQLAVTPLTLTLLQLITNEQTMQVVTVPPPVNTHATKRTAIIVQARKGSSRLPGKILQKIGTKTVLEHVIGRLSMVPNADVVVIATTTQATDDEIAELAAQCGATVFRGDEHDVLSRYLGAARAVDADVILRVTSDCPLIDPTLCARVISARALNDSDYASNNMPRLFPHGLDCEAFTRKALEAAARDATESYDREHVTPWLRRHPDMHRVNVIGPGWPANQQRWTLDYPEDLTFFKRLFAEMAIDYVPSWQETLSLINRVPELDVANARHRVHSAMANDPAAKIVVFRSVANERIGTGHAMRCQTLQTKLEGLGWRCYWAAAKESFDFLGNDIPQSIRIVLKGDNPVVDAKTVKATIGHCHVLVIDDYAVDKEFATAMRPSCSKIVYFDDLADRKIDADLIINPTPGNWDIKYAALNVGPVHLLQGPEFALLREQFHARRVSERTLLQDNSNKTVRRVLIGFGGVDPLNGTALALDLLADEPDISIDVVLGSRAPYVEVVREQIIRMGSRVRLWTDVAEMAALMIQADIVIGAPGTSTWERGCLGLPSILVGIAENQRENAAIVEKCGAGIVAGFLTTQSRDIVATKLAQHFTTLKNSHAARQKMALAATKICDGRGGQRIVAALLPEIELPKGRKLHLRLVETRDEDLLMDWQREPETRRYALNPTIPSAAEHHNWLIDRVASVADWFLMGQVDGEPAGYIRLDWIGEDNGRPEYLISIATARSYHRQGIATALLRAVRHLAPGAHFCAKVLPDNLASLSLFTSANYSLAADGYFHSLPVQRKEA